MSGRDIGLNVSRETIERLEKYLALLEKWNPAINLVSKSTIKDAWSRHFIDSAQIYKHATNEWNHWADFGSGGGFPGAVIAILANELRPNATVTLVESDQRKATFLRSVLRETDIKGTVVAKRVEAIEPMSADVISARALADLPALLAFAELHGSPNATYLFPKGISWQKELTLAQESWSFNHTAITSETDPNAIILKIGDLVRA
ncbi:MAG: 16S rRNA (guanine(527)-N(7))-methyltransferase RsmG [Paracoccaceae bacterium]|nr:16S rRNA (guanine(527)-N(7))-methyltransferase RsmG [Paracoccaceae bacterium]MDG1738416.1 16S rRNA (guanine(527)-N(7))-methyltransferase RsmG [Paracoccaceae bacterium]MDG2259837.1 16S rRNA (guanine(527)-N(7))-methyltransferase RsmG [Paracoccaceae bacterium]